jgi:uncharacterized membrane protein YeaQ/YmgE (transglycosylase-associated protein family)
LATDASIVDKLLKEERMGICSWILFGAIAGWIASLITGRSDRMGCLGNIFVGIIGAAIGGAIVGIFGGSGVTAAGQLLEYSAAPG